MIQFQIGYGFPVVELCVFIHWHTLFIAFINKEYPVFCFGRKDNILPGETVFRILTYEPFCGFVNSNDQRIVNTEDIIY